MLGMPDDSMVSAIDVKAVRFHSYFFRSDRFYVRVELRDGSTRDVVEHVSKDVAQDKQSEIIAALQGAMEEVEPYEYGYQAGLGEGNTAGRSEGFTEGRSQGYQEGLADGQAEARRGILAAIYQRREAYVKEQAIDLSLPPSKRRYPRNAISVLTDIIQYIFPG
jgi:flagellar biosynthesis/type III secretory pathway protein FliH